VLAQGISLRAVNIFEVDGFQVFQIQELSNFACLDEFIGWIRFVVMVGIRWIVEIWWIRLVKEVPTTWAAHLA